jgi:hypothetical protein
MSQRAISSLAAVLTLVTVGCGSSGDNGSPAPDAAVSPDAAASMDTGTADTGTAADSMTAAPDGSASAGKLSMTLDGVLMTAMTTVGSVSMSAGGTNGISAFFGNPILDPQMGIRFPPDVALGTFDQMPANGLYINFDQERSVWLCDRYIMGSSCTMTITAFGGPGEKVAGTFSGTLVKNSGPHPAMTRTITNGSFEFTR